MRLSWKLGRVAGIDLFLHPSALIVFLLASNVAPSGLESAAFVVALFASIVLHELGHALTARRYGIGTADITLYLFGGVARLRRMPRSAGPELLIALAGPAVNFAIALGLVAVIALTEVLGVPAPFPWMVLSLNLGLGLFNLLPVFPMDGGRVLRALLSGWLGRVRATEVAATLGRCLAVAGGLLFLTIGKWEGVILALFIYTAAGMERAQVLAEGRPARVPEGFAHVPPPPAGFRWADRGDGVLRLVPNLTPFARPGHSWN